MRQQHTPTTGMPEAHEKDRCGSSQSVGRLNACNIIFIKAASSLTPAFTATLLPCDASGRGVAGCCAAAVALAGGDLDLGRGPWKADSRRVLCVDSGVWSLERGQLEG